MLRLIESFSVDSVTNTASSFIFSLFFFLQCFLTVCFLVFFLLLFLSATYNLFQSWLDRNSDWFWSQSCDWASCYVALTVTRTTVRVWSKRILKPQGGFTLFLGCGFFYFHCGYQLLFFCFVFFKRKYISVLIFLECDKSLIVTVPAYNFCQRHFHFAHLRLRPKGLL